MEGRLLYYIGTQKLRYKLRIESPQLLLRPLKSPSTPRSTRIAGIYPARKLTGVTGTISARPGSPPTRYYLGSHPPLYTAHIEGRNYRPIYTIAE